MATNSLLNPAIITRRAMVEFKNEMVLLEKVDRQLDPLFEGKIGSSVSVRKRVRYTAGTSADITSDINDSIEGKVLVTLDKRRVVAMQFDSVELALDIEEFSERYIRPAMIELVQQVETAIAEEYKKIWNVTGTAGTNPSTFLQIGTAGAILSEQGVPNGMNDRSMFYTPSAALSMADGLKNVFPTEIATKAIEYAYISKYAGFMVYESQSLATHTAGVGTGTPLVNGAAQVVTYLSVKDTYESTLITDGWTNSTAGILLEGDVITIAGVNSLNPRTRKSTGRLQMFVVRADATSGATTGPATLAISPPIITAGPNATVDAAPADDAVITTLTGASGVTSSQNLGFTKDAITCAFGQLTKPIGNVQYGRETLDGISVRLVGDYEVLGDTNTWRFDILFAVVAQNPGMAIRHLGA